MSEHKKVEHIRVIDSHTGGEPTRVVVSGGPGLGTGTLAERRDLMVATYSSARGTAARSMTCVLTGIACGAGCFASVLLHPVCRREMNRIGKAKGTSAKFFILVPQVATALSLLNCRYRTKDAREMRRDSEWRSRNRKHCRWLAGSPAFSAVS